MPTYRTNRLRFRRVLKLCSFLGSERPPGTKLEWRNVHQVALQVIQCRKTLIKKILLSESTLWLPQSDTMSYILQGSGALLGPCLGNLLGREVARYAPCICLRCAQLISNASQPAITAAVQQRLPGTATVGGGQFEESSRTNEAGGDHPTGGGCRPLVQYQHYRTGSDGVGRLLRDTAKMVAGTQLVAPELRRRFPSATFQQKYFTNFSAPLPYLGHAGPVNVNLTFLCDPGVSHTGTVPTYLL